MTCRDVIEFLMDYESGSLLPEERAVFDAHLVICPACVNYLETYRKTVAFGRSAFDSGDPFDPPEIPEDLVQAILAARRSQS